MKLPRTEVGAASGSTLALAIIVALVIAGSALLVVRSIRLHNRGPIIGPPGTPIITEMKKWRCTTSKAEVNGACAESWWEHWWDGLPYCEDAEADCKLYGGEFKYVD